MREQRKRIQSNKPFKTIEQTQHGQLRNEAAKQQTKQNMKTGSEEMNTKLTNKKQENEARKKQEQLPR